MNKVSVQMIVRKEEQHLRRCLDSVARYVDELVVVDTGSTDRTKEIAAGYGAVVLDRNPETHPQFFFMDDETTEAPPPYTRTMALGDFGAVRNAGLERTTGDFVLWLDADDELEGGENLRGLVDQMARQRLETAWINYLYGFDEAGRVTCQLWRERVVKRGGIRWANPIHEVMIPILPERAVKIANIVVRHHRPPERTAAVALRNYKVLLRHLKDNPNDARTLFYFGNEARHINPDQAIDAYERYCELSGWSEERAFARACLGELYEQKAQMGRAWANFAAATVESINIPDGWFGLGRIAYYRQDWTDCARLMEEGFRRGNPEGVLMFTPLARTFAPHLFYHTALNNLGRVADAMASCDKGLAVIPDNAMLRHNRDVFNAFLSNNGVRLPRPRAVAGLDVVFWTGPSVEPWGPKSPNGPGIGGSETACIELSRHLARLGHRVIVYADCSDEVVDGVTWRHFRQFAGADCDVFISSRQPGIMDAPIKAALKLLWVHDIHVGQPQPKMHELLLKFDRVLCLSDWHKRFFLSVYPFVHPDTVLVTRNGIDPARFELFTYADGPRMPAKQNRLVYSSSPNRGLHVRLDLSPRVRAEVP